MQPIDIIPDPHDLTLVTQGELDNAVEKHAKYMRGQNGGARLVLQYKNLSGLNFKARSLQQADFTASLMVGCDLSDCDFKGANFFACDLRNANLRNAKLTRADFRGAYVAGADLTEADLTEADLREGKIMVRGDDGMLEDRKRSGGQGAVTVFKGAKLTRTNMADAQARYADFSDADMSRASLHHADLSDTVMNGANLAYTDFSGANLTDVSLQKSIMTGTILAGNETRGINKNNAITDADMGNSLAMLGKTLPELLEEHTLWVATGGMSGHQLDLSGYDLRDVVDLRQFPLTAIEAVGANFLAQDLRRAELQSANFDRADFRDCDMRGADLRGSTFKYAMLTRADLGGTKICPLEFKNEDGSSWFKRPDLSGANLRFCSFEDADLRDCILMGVDLSNANLRHCDLRRTDLTGAILSGANLDGAKLDDAQVDLAGV